MKCPEPHPLAELFPMLDAEKLQELADDMGRNGQREKIMMLDGRILDGRNRQEACRLAGIKAQYAEYDGPDPLGFVLSKNLHRRHLSESQRAMVAAQLVDWENGMNQHNAGPANLPTRRAAEKLCISERAVTAAKRIQQYGATELIDAITAGRVSVHAGDELSRLQHAAQCEVLALQEREIIQQAKDIRTRRLQSARIERINRLATISERNDEVLATLPRGTFPVVYADVPWRETVWSEETGRDNSYPYPTMSLDEIMDLCAGDNSPATKDAGLFFWTTGNRVDLAVDVIRAWGFDFKSSLVWDKVHMGNGRWVRDRHEILMIASRGDFPAPLPGTQEQSLFSEIKGGHSAKPERVRQMIERLYIGVPKLELFARGPAQGWSVWGNEAT